MKQKLLIVVISLSLALITVSAHCAPVGEFTIVRGNVDITSPGQEAREVSAGEKVSVGDIVRSKSRSKAEITFDDGSIVRLAPSSRIEIPEYLVGKNETRSIFKLFRGKIQNKVKKLVGMFFGIAQRNRYEVHTPTAVIGVRGTDFFAYHQANLSGAVFSEGKGYGYALNKPDIIREIEAGQAMVAPSPETPPTIRPATEVEINQHRKDTNPDVSSTDEGAKIKKNPSNVIIAEEQGDGETSQEQEGSVQQVREAQTTETTLAQENETAELPVTETNPGAAGGGLPEPPPLLSVQGSLTNPVLQGDLSGTVPGLITVNGTYDTRPDSVFTANTRGTIGDRGRFAGFAGGTWTSWDLNSLSIAVDSSGNAGYLTGTFGGANSGGNFSGTGFMSYVPITSNAGINANDLTSSLTAGNGTDTSMTGTGVFSGGGSISATQARGTSASISGQDWGIVRTAFSGDYSGTTSDSFELSLQNQTDSFDREMVVEGMQWSENHIAGRGAGSWVSINDAATGVTGTELAGTFDPSSSTWDAVMIGGWMETSRFLAMTRTSPEELETLNIPAVEVGSVDLAGSDGNLNVRMDDVTFFAYSTGAPPRIWATDAVSGTYGSEPVADQTTVGVSGASGDAQVNADFSINHWQNQTWAADIHGAGTVGDNPLEISGAAAGNYQGNSLEGTASGMARTQ